MNVKKNTMSRAATLVLGFSTVCAAHGSVGGLSVADASTNQPASGPGSLLFTVTRTGDLSFPVNVPYATADDTARAGTDYTAATGSLHFEPNASTATISVPLAAGSNALAKAFKINLSTPPEVAEAAIPPGSITTFVPIAQGDSRDVVEADFNGDGKPDLASGTVADGTFLRNTTQPGATSASYVAAGSFPGTGSNCVSLQATDVNGDGRPDLVYAATGASVFNVALNLTPPGASSFTFEERQQISLPEGASANLLRIGDFDGDGRPDLALSARGSLLVYRNQTPLSGSEVSFALDSTINLGSAIDFTAADVDGDGRTDLATIQEDRGYFFQILRNTGAPGFVAFELTEGFPIGNQPKGLKLADFNRDGRVDFTVATGDGLQILLNTTDRNSPPSVSVHTVTPTVAAPVDLQVADFNNDGLLDISVASKRDNISPGAVEIFQNRTVAGSSTPTFKRAANVSAPANTFARVVNANGDGKPDLLLADVNLIIAGAVTKLFVATNVTPQPPPTLLSYAKAANAPAPYANNIATGDFNNDGKADLATADFYDTVSVLLNTTPADAGTPSYAPAATFAAGDDPYDIAAADFNLDGRLDLVSVNYNDTNINIFTNATLPRGVSASFRRSDVSDGEYHYSVTIGDFNADGKPDIATGTFDGTVSVLLNTSVPGAAAPSFVLAGKFNKTNGNYLDIEAGDFNGDGLPDIAFVNSGFPFASGVGRVSVMFNTGNSGSAITFGPAVDFGTGLITYDIAVGDINGDGRDDIVAGNYYDTNIFVLLNTSDPGAGTPSFSITNLGAVDGEFHYDVLLRDLDGDGRLDLATATFGDVVTVLHNATVPGSSAPSFTLFNKYPVARGAFGLVTADFNGDGRPDLATSSYNKELVSTLLNTQYRVVLDRGTAVGTIDPPLAQDATVDLDISGGTDVESAIVGDLIAFNFVITNNGEGDSSGATVAVSSSSTLEVDSIDAGQGVSCMPNGDGVSCAIAAIAAGSSPQSGVTTIRFRAKSAGTGTISASVTGAEGQTDPTSDNDSITQSFEIVAADITPDSFSFTNVIDVDTGSAQESEAVEIVGINVGAPFSVTGGFAKVSRGIVGFGPCTEASGTIYAGDRIALCHTASAVPGTKTTTTLTIGAQAPLMGVMGSFSSTTREVKAPVVSLALDDMDSGSGYLIRFRETTVNASDTQLVTLTNTGNAPLLISSITSTGDFKHTSNCGASIRAAGSCTISIVFKPTQTGTRTGETRIVSNAVSSPDLIKLSGVGKARAPGITTNISRYDFGNVKVGESSPARELIITSSGTSPLEIRTISVSGDYNGNQNCPKVLEVGKSCTLTGRFKPKAKGARPGSITITSNAPDSPTVIPLSGNGT